MSSYSDKVIADGASAYWRLGETSGTTAVDMVGGNNGVISGGVTLGQSGALADGDKAMLFNGTTGKIVVTPFTLPSPMTLEAWVRSPTRNIAFISTRGGSGNIFFGINGVGQLMLYVTLGIEGGPAIDNDQWHHVIATNNGTTTTLYVDGLQIAQGSQTYSTSGPLNICYDPANASYWLGFVDEVAIYPVALTATQILAHYNLGRTNFQSGSYPARIISDGASAFWRLGETSGTTAVDVIGGANGTISGGVSLGQSGALGGDSDKAMLFDGVNGKIVIPNGSYLAYGTGPASVEWWLRTSQANSSTFPIDFKEDGTSGVRGIGFDLLTSAIRMQVSTGAGLSIIVTANITYADNQWHHIVGVVTRAPDTAWIYIDGTLRAQLALADTGGSLTQNTYPAVIGCRGAAGGGAGGNFFTGQIDEVAVYTAALTPQQIATHYALSRYAAGSYPSRVISDGCSAYWRLGETSGTTAQEEIGNADGTISGGVTLGQAGALSDGDKAMRFTGGRITVLNGAFLQFGTGPMSVEWWIKCTTGQTGWWLDCRDNATNPGFGYQSDAANLYFHPKKSGEAQLYVGDGSFGYGNNQWHHIVGVVERGSPDVARFYADGVLRTTLNFAGSGGSLTSTLPFIIGDITGGGAPVTGYIDEVALYPTALTPTQIAAHYEARTFTAAQLPIIPWSVVGGMSLRDNMDSYNVWEPITPHDTNDINHDGELTDAVLVGGAGDVAAVMQNGVVVVLKGLPAGAWVPIAARRIRATGTTATDLIALYQN